MGACLHVFPNEFRRHRVWEEKWRRQDQHDPAVTMAEADSLDPAVQAIGNIYVAGRLAAAGDRERDIVALTMLRYSQEEIAELVGKRSVRAVEGTLYRWRTREKGYLEASEQ